MTRVALLSSEAIRPRMAGIGIRYLEMARRLPRYGFEVLLVSPAAPPTSSEAAALGLPATVFRTFERGRLREILDGCEVAVAQGQLANDLLLELPHLPAAIDLYDPWLIENLSYFATLGLDPYRNDHATWVLQLSRGDFFLCSSEEQRTFYLGFLTALGRVNPERLSGDPDLATLIAPVPFGVPESLPPHRPVLPERAPGERRLLFGGLYDWYDPATLLDALACSEMSGRPWTLLLIRNPNPEATPQRLFAEVEARCRRQGWGDRIQILDWIAAERRYDLLRDVDLLVAPHRPSLETRLSLRTRFLDALAAGCPVITSEGGTMGRLLVEHGAGWVVPPGDAAALAAALVEALDRPPALAAAQAAGAQRLLAAYSWDRALAPLVRFCQEPRTDPTKERFAHRPATVAPPDHLGFRVRRYLRRHLSRWLEEPG
ncbi:MAG TPA: glycosyltransferase family 4 protein [Thermoanaerobaculia bacterium]|nr:glycosyltransferase family 4 protein [Thermoanaerobaculia bacterium]